VAYYLAAAMIANRRKKVYRTLEAVKHVSFARRRHLERLIIIVATYFTLCHTLPPSQAENRDSFFLWGATTSVRLIWQK
jgi:hypothetical protein